jgi:hypothetical protein
MLQEKSVWGALVMIVACNTTTSPESPSISDAAKSDAARPAVGAIKDAAKGNEAAGPDDASPADATTGPEDAGYPAPMPCDMDASLEASVTACPPPLSVCASSQKLMYFAWGECLAGSCSWPQMLLGCPYGCWSGGCLGPPTQ